MRPYPKQKRVKLNSKEYHELRLRKYMSVSCCCEVCHVWTSLETGHLDHYPKTKGAGAGDTMEETRWVCYKCHDKRHRGL